MSPVATHPAKQTANGSSKKEKLSSEQIIHLEHEVRMRPLH